MTSAARAIHAPADITMHDGGSPPEFFWAYWRAAMQLTRPKVVDAPVMPAMVVTFACQKVLVEASMLPRFPWLGLVVAITSKREKVWRAVLAESAAKRRSARSSAVTLPASFILAHTIGTISAS